MGLPEIGVCSNYLIEIITKKELYFLLYVLFRCSCIYLCFYRRDPLPGGNRVPIRQEVFELTLERCRSRSEDPFSPTFFAPRFLFEYETGFCTHTLSLRCILHVVLV
jgi:hypothetical protein